MATPPDAPGDAGPGEQGTVGAEGGGRPPPSVAHACVNACRACSRRSYRVTATAVCPRLLASASCAVRRTTGPSGGRPGAASCVLARAGGRSSHALAKPRKEGGHPWHRS
eukprot:5506592-Prymnesium_polylepis.1